MSKQTNPTPPALPVEAIETVLVLFPVSSACAADENHDLELLDRARAQLTALQHELVRLQQLHEGGE
jgi:hypothetical protein